MQQQQWIITEPDYYDKIRIDSLIANILRDDQTNDMDDTHTKTQIITMFMNALQGELCNVGVAFGRSPITRITLLLSLLWNIGV